MQGQKGINKTSFQALVSRKNTIQCKKSEVTTLMKSFERGKYTTNINKENSQSNQIRFSIKSRPTEIVNNHLAHSMHFQTLQVKQNTRKQIEDKENGRLIQSMIYQTKKYLSITDSFINNPNKIQQKVRRQGANTARELIELITNYEENRNKTKADSQSNMNSSNLVLGCNKSLSSSYHFPSGLAEQHVNANYIKKIENLEQEKTYLESVISQHERANIKMFIKLNQGQSEQIQKYKKLLSSLFQKYKQLQNLVSKYSEKVKKLQIKLEESVKKQGCGKLCEVNVCQLKKKIGSYQQIVNEQNQCLGNAVQQIEQLRKKIYHYQQLERDYRSRLAQLEKQQKKQLQKASINSNNQLARSTCSSDMIIEGYNSNNSNFSLSSYNNNKSPPLKLNSSNVESQEIFSNIKIKPASIQKYDQSFARLLLIQAVTIQQGLIK